MRSLIETNERLSTDGRVVVEKVKYTAIGMYEAWQIMRRFGWATETRTRSAADYSITATLSVVPDSLDTNVFLPWGMDLWSVDA